MITGEKVAIIIWDISCIGGIATQAMDFKRVFDEFGIKNDIIILKDTHVPFLINNFEIVTDLKNFKVKGIELSIREENIKKTAIFLKRRYTTLIHATACIHNDSLPWDIIYRLGLKNIVIISDVYWNKYYPYFDKVLPFIKKIYATNYGVKNYLGKEKGLIVEELLHPFYFEPNFIKDNPKKIVVWVNQWRGWKGIKLFIKLADKIDGEIWLFGGGREYYNLRDKLPKNSKYFGFVSPKNIEEAYKQAMCAVDLTGQSEKYYGHYNRTTIEPMFWKCVSVCNDKLVEPYSFIPKDVVLPVNKDNFVEKINNILNDRVEFERLSNLGFNWAINKYDHKLFIRQFI